MEKRRIVASFLLIAMIGVNAPVFGVAAQGNIVEGDLIKTANSPDVYIVKFIGDKQFKRLILNPDIFNSYGHLEWENIKTVSDAEVSAFTESGLVRAVGDSKVYELSSTPESDDGEKRWLNMTGEEFVADGYDWDSIYAINSFERNLYVTGGDLLYGGKGGEPVETGILVSVSPNTPGQTQAAKNAKDHAFTRIDFTASENVTVNSISVLRGGIAQDSDISEVKIFDGSTRLGNVAALNTNTHKATFTGLSWVLPSGVTKTLTVKASIASGATTGSSPKMGIAQASDIVLSSDLPFLGEFPVSGNAVTISGISSGRLDVTARTVPADNSPVAGSTDQEIASWTFESVSEGLEVRKITITQIGSATTQDVRNIVLKVNGQQIGETVSELSSAGTATFDLTNDPLDIKSGTSKIVYANADIGTGSNIVNRTVEFEITDSSDVEVFGSNSSGLITITTDEGGDGSTFVAQDGIAQTISQGGNFTATIYNAYNPSAQSYVNGRAQELLSAFKLSAGSTEDMRVSRMKLQLFGTGADATDLSNVTMYLFDEAEGTETQIDYPTNFVGTIATYGFNSTGLDEGILDIAKSKNAIIFVRADVSSSASWTGLGVAINGIKVDGIQSETDIDSANINISGVDATDGTEATLHNANLDNGTISVTTGVNNPTADEIVPGAKDAEFAEFDFTASGEDITLSSVTINLCDGGACVDGNDGSAENGDFTNVKLFHGTSMLGKVSASPNNSATFNFNLLIEKDETVTLTVTADVPTDAASVWDSSNAAVALDTTMTATGVSSSATITEPSADVLGNTMTISGETLTVGFKILPATTLVKNASGAVLAKAVLTAGTSGDVRVSSIKFSFDDATTLDSASDAKTIFGSLKLYDVTDNSAGVSMGSLQTITDNTPDYVTFSGLGITIDKGTSKVIELRGSVLATSAGSMYVGFADLVDGGDGTDVVATGLSSNTTVYGTGTNADNSGAITIATAGTLTVAVDGSTPNSKFVAVGTSGKTGVELAKFKFTANTESVTVKRLKVTLAQSNNSGSTNDVKNFSKLELYGGETLLATVFPTGSNASAAVSFTFNFESKNFKIDRDDDVVFTLKANMNGTANGALSNTTPNFYIADVTGAADLSASGSNIDARGSLSGETVTVSAGSVNPETLSGTEPSNVNAITVVRAKPIFAPCAKDNCTKVSPSGTLLPGVSEVIRFRITAEGDDVIFDGTNHNIRFTIAQSGGAAGDRVAKLYEVGKSTALQSVTVADLTSAGTIDFDALNSTIAKGGYKEYYVTVDLTDYATTGDTFRLAIESTTSDVSWSDNETTDITSTITDGLPMTGGTLVK